MRKPDIQQRGFGFLAPDEIAVVAGVKRKCRGPVCIAKNPDGILKFTEEFPKLTAKSKCTWCKECITAQKKKSDDAKVKIEATKAAKTIKTVKIEEKDPEIDIPIEDYNELHNLQHGRCAICNVPEFRKAKHGKGYESVPLRVDRECETAQVRGLLCSECYLRVRQLGWEWLHTAEEYCAKAESKQDVT